MADVELQVDPDGVAVITLNRPERLNAMSGGMTQLLGEAYVACDGDDAVRVVVLTGAGRAFSAGADLSPEAASFSAPSDPSTFRSSPVQPPAWTVRKPVIAAINGHAIGLGMTVAMQCDIRFMAEDAKWGIVQSARGVVPDAQSHWTVVQAVGLARAAEILLRGATFTGADDALRLGVASRVLPAGEVLPAALALAREMAVNVSPLSAGLSKRILWAATTSTAEEVDELEREAHLIVMGRPDSREGGAAFFGRRPPRWESAVPRDWPDDGPFVP
jgi:enoyl-CoA hydratase/carnithine racemase